ncbi:MAG: hypothetical protein ACRDWH_05370 [Acidimicrobiia bacterium]
MSMRKNLGLAAAGATLGLLLGATVLSPTAATAQESRTNTEESDRVGRLRSALDELVSDGVITADQADAVAAHLAGLLPEPGRHFIGRGRLAFGLDEAAEAIGIERSAVVDSLREGESIADVAADNGVDSQVVIDALVARHQAHLDRLVEDGSLTGEEAAERAARALEWITAFVNGDLEFRPGFMVRPQA